MQDIQAGDLPDLSGDYSLTSAQINDYQENGHICLRAVALPEEVAAYRGLIGQAVREKAAEYAPISARNTYGKAFIQLANLWERSEALKRFSFARRFAKIAADLMGVDGVRMYHDQALFKEPGGGHTPWHQDQVLWPIDEGKAITMWMPLVDISAEMGSMTFASGTQRLGYAKDLVISDESHRTLADFIRVKGYETRTHGSMAAGDATFHDGWTMHSAPGNPTDRAREVMTVIYVADGARVTEKKLTSPQKHDLESCVPGAGPGDLIASPLNPVLYRKARN